MDGNEAREPTREPARNHRPASRLRQLSRPLGAAIALAGFVFWAHLGSGIPVFHAHVATQPGWPQFQARYRLDDFGDDGYFVRAVQNGYNVFHFTHRYAARFTRKTSAHPVSSCASCHTPEDLAYGFVNADRFDAALGRRVSFEERVMRCLAGPMEGFVPTLYDPTVRDLRALARAVAHHLQLSEGALREGG